MYLKGCHPPEMQGCWHEGCLIKLLTFCLTGRKFDQSFLRMFLLFLFKKWPNVWCHTCIIACAGCKLAHHWSPASKAQHLGPLTALHNSCCRLIFILKSPVRYFYSLEKRYKAFIFILKSPVRYFFSLEKRYKTLRASSGE